MYTLSNASVSMTIEEIQNSNQFQKINTTNDLNFGITYATHWLKIKVKNLDSSQAYVLHLETTTPDSIEVYEQSANTWNHKYIGEGFFGQDRYLNYIFSPCKTEASLYMKVIGNGQPIALPISIIEKEAHAIKRVSLFFSGISYGIVVLILMLNAILYLFSFDKLYLYIFLYNFFASIVLLYFDGFIKLFIVPNSLYWNNQSIAIGICGSFIMTNFYIPQFIRLHTYKTAFNLLFKVATVVMAVLLVLSFWHPTGFKCWVWLNVIMLTLEATLLFCSVLYIRKKEKEYFLLQFASVVALIVFGTVSQLYFLGMLPINYFTVNVISYMVLSQIFLQTFALGQRISIIISEKSKLQDSLLRLSEQHSQSLILTLENERKRMSSEFHDGIGQNILVIRNRILLMLKKDKLSALQFEKLNGLATLTSETMDEVRDIAQDLRPSMLDSIGIRVSIMHLVEKIKKSTLINIDFSCSDNIDAVLPKDMEINFYRILQELFNNLLKHSRAQSATVAIHIISDVLIINFKDDGIGFDLKSKVITGTGNGVSGMKERVNILKGQISIESAINEGTSVVIHIPIIKP
ncbi:MAG: 7TM diverse intracellular signaling domain-containing protein [Cytophagales bacterium]